MGLMDWLLAGVYLELGTIKSQLNRMEDKMDQERVALDGLVVALNEHFTSVDAGIAKILELAGAEPDVDNSEEISTLASEIQASTQKIRDVLPVP